MQGNDVQFRVIHAQSTPPAEEQAASGQQVFVVEDSLGYLLNYAARLSARLHARSLAQHGVSLGQWAVLLFLWGKDGVSQTELSRQVAIDDATMVRAIDRMERDGLVQRQRNAHDRRQMQIFLTDKGQSLRDVLVPLAIAGNEETTRPFTAAEQHQLHDLLRRLIVVLERMLPLDGRGGTAFPTEPPA